MPLDFWEAKKFTRNRFERIDPPRKRRRKRKGSPPWVPFWWLWAATGVLVGGLLRDLMWRAIEILHRAAF